MKNDTGLLLRVTKDKMSRVKNDTDLLLRVRQDTQSKVRDDAELLLRVREEFSEEWHRPVAKSKKRKDE